MRKCIFMMFAALLFGCSEHQLIEDITETNRTKAMKETGLVSVDIDALVARARWGNGEAFLQLADCYKDGIGVQSDLLGMMYTVAQARALGAIETENDYLLRISDDNVFKFLFELLNKNPRELREKKDSILPRLNMLDSPDALAVSGIVSIENGDSVKGLDKIRKAAQNGSNFAILLNASLDKNGELNPDIHQLEQVAERVPLAYKMLGRIYLSSDKDGNIEEKRAAYYYQKAEKHALLFKREARWLLSYHNDGGEIQLDNEDVRRLQAFVRATHERENIIAADTVCVDSTTK